MVATRFLFSGVLSRMEGVVEDNRFGTTHSAGRAVVI